MTRMMRLLLATSLAALLVAAPASAARRHTCYWTRSGTLTNQTGYPVHLSDRDGVLRDVLVPANGVVSFGETFPLSVKQHFDYLTTTSLDFSGGAHPAHGWQFSDTIWIFRPNNLRCPR